MQPIGNDAIFAFLKHENRNEDAFIAGAAHPPDLNGRISLTQRLGNFFAGELDAGFISGNQ